MEELQASSDSSYFARFWRKGLEQQLLWKVPRKNLPSALTSHGFLSILHAKVQLASDSDLGSIESGYIYARGILKAAFWDGITIVELEELLKETLGAVTSSDRWIDEGARQRDHNLMCMPVLYQMQFQH